MLKKPLDRGNSRLILRRTETRGQGAGRDQNPEMKTLAPRIGTVDPRRAGAPKEADPHYLSPAHRRWRAGVIARARGRCEWPGCGRTEPRMYADHIIELRDGGAAQDPANGQCLCARHHAVKTAAARAARQSR
jgi:hypothetical protein